MRKEAIVCVVVITIICILNFITQNYTKDSIQAITGELEDLKVELINKNEEAITTKMKAIKKQWKDRYNKLAYFIEHDELEKVETDLVALEGFIEVNDYDTGISELNKSIFVLEHIAQKYTFNLVNIF